jgi:hypothetical protein
VIHVTNRLARRLLCAAAAVLALSAMSVATPADAGAAPTASTGASSAVTFSSAVVHGSVNPHGQATTYFFQYGPSRKFGLQTPLAPAGGGGAAIKVSQQLSGLQADTTYHYRLVAMNAGGAAVGADHTFTTPKIPLSLAIAGVPNPVPFGAGFTVEGTLAGTDGPHHLVRLQANAFPYTGHFQDVGNPVLTNATGGFAIPFLGLLENTELRVVTVGGPTVVSPIFIEGVSVRVSLHARRTGRRGFARLFGTVTPAEVGSLVGFQLLRPGHRSVNVGGTVVKLGSRFSRVVHVRHGAVYKALVRVTDGAHVSGYSSPILIR